jgi:hypothetical protein
MERLHIYLKLGLNRAQWAAGKGACGTERLQAALIVSGRGDNSAPGKRITPLAPLHAQKASTIAARLIGSSKKDSRF